MKFPYKKLTNRLNLGMGIFWSIFAFTDFLRDDFRWITIFKVLIALLYIFIYIYSTKNGLLYIDDKIIKHYKFPAKEIKINAITEITKVFDEYKITSTDKTITISTQTLDKEYVELLEQKIQEIKKIRNL